MIPAAEVDGDGNVQLKFDVKNLQIPQHVHTWNFLPTRHSVAAIGVCVYIQGLVRAMINGHEAAVFDTAPGSLYVTQMMAGEHRFECLLLNPAREPLMAAENAKIVFVVPQVL